MKLQFAEFLIDSDARQLLRNGTPVHVSRKAFDVLCLLVERRPDAVTKDELHARLWPGTFVVDANLSVAIAEIRRAVGDEPQSPRFIRTVHRVGYAFCGEASEGLRRSAGSSPRAWLLRGETVLRLDEGENLIGRDPGCGVWLDESGVSRRHARLLLRGDEASLEDLGSKNGTWLNGKPLTTAGTLGDGDQIRIGPVQVEFRTSSHAVATETVRLRP